MSSITKNLKIVGIVNTVFIAISLMLDGYIFGKYPSLLSSPLYVASNILKTISIICGFIYAISGYKKNAAKYYKGFMLLQLLARIIEFVSDLYYTLSYDVYANSYFTTVFKFIIVICIAILAFAKDFGKEKSLIVVYLSFVCDALVLVRVLITYSDIIADVILAFTYLILSCITIIFVEAKYIDKESRGAK